MVYRTKKPQLTHLKTLAQFIEAEGDLVEKGSGKKLFHKTKDEMMLAFQDTHTGECTGEVGECRLCTLLGLMARYNLYCAREVANHIKFDSIEVLKQRSELRKSKRK